MSGTPDIQTDLLLGFHILDEEGQNSGIAGHLTARAPGTETFWSHSYGQSFEEVRAETVRHADFALNPLNGGQVNPSLQFHVAIFQRRPDVGAVAHTHPVNAIALTAIGAGFEPVFQSALMLYDDCAFFGAYDGVVETPESAARLADALGAGRALLLKNHGIITVGASVREAVIAAVILEQNCAIQLKAMAAGALQGLPEAAARQAKTFLNSPRVIGMRWAHLARKAARARPFLPQPPALGEAA